MASSQDWIFKKEFLEDVNSVRFNHSTDVKKEKESRFKTIWFIKDLSQALRPGPTKEQLKDRKEEEAEYDIRNLKVLWTACAFFHRFYVFHSFDSHSRFAVAVACLFLASKVEEKPLRLSDHVYMYFRLRKNKVLKKSDQEFKDMERDVLLAERILLQTLGFDLNVPHPYQYFRQIIGKDLKGWFSDPEDSKEVLRLATTLLTDSFRSTLCLLYTPQQTAYALVFMTVQILALKPTITTTSSSSLVHRDTGRNGVNLIGTHSDTTWLDIFEKDIDEGVLKMELYETSFIPTDLPYPVEAHGQLRHGLNTQLDRLSSSAAANSSRTAEVEKSEPDTPPLSLSDREGMEESKEDSTGGMNKRKLPTTQHTTSTDTCNTGSSSNSNSVSSSSTVPTSTGKFRYTSLPPPFPSTDTVVSNTTTGLVRPSLSAVAVSSAVAPPSSPCHNAPTPRSTYPSSSRVRRSSVDSTDEVIPPPPDSPMCSSYSTFSQAHQANLTRQEQQQPGIRSNIQETTGGVLETPEGGFGDTPTYMPPPPDTPGSMASTPNFDSLPRPDAMLHDTAFNVLHSAKKARVDY